MDSNILQIQVYQSETNAESCVALASLYSQASSEYSALCDAQYLESELKHYTSGEYSESANPTELELLGVARQALSNGVAFLLINAYEV